MKREMELVRKILFSIEEQYQGEDIYCLNIDGYEKITVAEHCKLLYEYGLIDNYKPIGADGVSVIAFFVGNMTWEGYDFLEKIRQDTVWNKTKEVIAKKGLPMVIDVIKDVATGIISAAMEGAIKGLK